MTLASFILAAVLFETQQGGVTFKVESETQAIDPAHSAFLRVELTTPRDKIVTLPDLRERVTGFSLAEDFTEEPKTDKNGATTQVANWKLIPEPYAKTYKIRPFVVGDFIAGPIYFDPPAAREPVIGGMEVNISKDLPPLSLKLAGQVALALVVLAALVAGLVALVRYVARRVKEHRMSPVERAWVELDRLLKKGLPGRGRYKDFYVELTMVVRRYVQRQHGVVAPHLTTEEFFDATRNAPSFPKSTLDELIDFLRKADMVKFAGVEATPETADGATSSARTYITKDDEIMRRQAKRNGETK